MTENERFTWKTVHGWQTPAFLEVMNGLDKKNQQLKKENKQLKDEIKMLKLTIARNEAYITRLTKKGKWTK